MRNILKAILVISAVSAGFPAMANGSMGIDVRVIEVRPSPSIIRLGQERTRAKAEQKARIKRVNDSLREMERRDRQDRRELEKRIKELDKKMHRERFKAKKKGR